MEKSMLEMSDSEILEHVRGLIKKREEQVLEKAVKKVKETTTQSVKRKMKDVNSDPGLRLLADFFDEEKKK